MCLEIKLSLMIIQFMGLKMVPEILYHTTRNVKRICVNVLMLILCVDFQSMFNLQNTRESLLKLLVYLNVP